MMPPDCFVADVQIRDYTACLASSSAVVIRKSAAA